MKATATGTPQQFCTCIMLFCTFLCRHCTTTTWKCLISRCTEEVHKWQRNFLSLSQLGCDSYEFNFRRVHLHLTKLVTWSNRDEDWKDANSLFQWRFLCRCSPRILRSLMTRWWQESHCSANGNLCFLEKASFRCISKLNQSFIINNFFQVCYAAPFSGMSEKNVDETLV